MKKFLKKVKKILNIKEEQVTVKLSEEKIDWKYCQFCRVKDCWRLNV